MIHFVRHTRCASAANQDHSGSLRFLDIPFYERAVRSDPAAVSGRLALDGDLLVPSSHHDAVGLRMIYLTRLNHFTFVTARALLCLRLAHVATMERALREVGYAEPDIKRMMGELMGAFDRSKEEGEAQWKKTRQPVLRRRAEAEAYAKAEQVEAQAVKSYTQRRKRTAPIVASWAEQTYSGAPTSGH
jgi:hypothetical protein